MYRRDNVVIPEKMKIVRVDDLGMFDTPAPVVLAPQDPCIHLQGLPVGCIPDAMGGHCKIVLIGPPAVLLKGLQWG